MECAQCFIIHVIILPFQYITFIFVFNVLDQTCYELVRKDRRKAENKDSHAQNPDLRSRSDRCFKF